MIKEEYNLQETKGFVGRWRDLRKGTDQTVNVIDFYCNYFEKYKNLILW